MHLKKRIRSLMLRVASVAIPTVLTLQSCVHLNSVSQTQIPADRSRKVTAENSRLIIFFLNFDNDYVDTMTESLRKTCPGGKITGILTKDETVNYFLGLVIKRRVVAEGFCEKGGAKA